MIALLGNLMQADSLDAIQNPGTSSGSLGGSSGTGRLALTASSRADVALHWKRRFWHWPSIYGTGIVDTSEPLYLYRGRNTGYLNRVCYGDVTSAPGPAATAGTGGLEGRA